MKNKEQGGFSLVEVLVSVFVLAVGIIGAAGIQLNALRTAQQTAFQTAGIQLASEMADKMRANAGRFNLTDDKNPFVNLDYSSADAPLRTSGASCHASACSAEELAAFEIREWENRIRDTLPGGRVRICRDALPWDSGTGTFRWTCTSAAAGMHTAALVIKIGWHGKGRNPDGSTIDDAGIPAPPNLAMTVAPYAE